MLLVAGWVLAGWLLWYPARWLRGWFEMSRSLRDQFVIGVVASYPATSVDEIDAGITKCTRALQRPDLTPNRRRNLLADVDKLLERRHAMTDAVSSTP